MVGTGRFSDSVVKFFAENYAIIVANGLEPGLPDACQEAILGDFANRVHAFNPNAKVIMYQATTMVHSRQPSLRPFGGMVESLLPCGLENVKPWMLARKDDGQLLTVGTHYYHNLSNPAQRAQWLDVVLNKSLGSNIAGVFADNAFDNVAQGANYMNEARAEAFFKGEQELMASLVLADKYVIFNNLRLHYTNGVLDDDLDALDDVLPFASAGYFEQWLGGVYRNTTTGKLNETKATEAMHRMINTSTTQPNKGVTLKSGPGPCVGYIGGQDVGCTWPFANHTTPPVPNKMNGSPTTAAARRAAAEEFITFPLATFLCAAGAKWHFDYAWGYTALDFVPGTGPNSTIDGQPQFESNVPDGWYSELLRAPGSPLGACSYDEATSTFAREWSGVSVSLNIATETAVLKWKAL